MLFDLGCFLFVVGCLPLIVVDDAIGDVMRDFLNVIGRRSRHPTTDIRSPTND